jgi:hypothetical protein
LGSIQFLDTLQYIAVSLSFNILCVNVSYVYVYHSISVFNTEI